MKYLVTLKPRGKFFFGGDRTFTSQERQNYYAHSTYFPQQTALLGMMRYALLNENGFLDKEAAEKNDFVGATGFDLAAIVHGIIKTISPVFILEQQNVWLSAGFDKQGYSPLQLIENKPLKMEGYDAKEGLSQRFVSTNASQEIQSLDYFFQDNPQVGNAKDREGKTQPDAFFKHNYKSFKRQEKINYETRFAFGFEIETTEEIELKTIRTVFLGAESSFAIELTPAKAIFDAIAVANESLKDKEANKHKIVLLSDCYVADLEALKGQSVFILTDGPVSFRFNKNKQLDYYKSITRSNQYNLLSRGTVIYPKDINAVVQILDAAKAFKAIGYNHYQIQPR